jgi:hypothetical protein
VTVDHKILSCHTANGILNDAGVEIRARRQTAF